MKLLSLVAPTVLASIGTLAIAVASRTLQARSRQLNVEPLEPIAVPEDASLGRLAKALRIQTVSYDDPSEIDYSAFKCFHSFIDNEYPALSRTLRKNVINEYGLLYEWTGSDPGLKPVVLTAHMDVVPVERDQWLAEPFDGQIEEGYLWGRGALDDKGSLVSILEAIEQLVMQGFRPRRTIYLGFGHDEERGSRTGREGARKIAESLKQRGVHAEVAMDEGLSILEGGASLVKGKRVALIGLAQKGYVSLRLSASSRGGHSMAPPVDHSTAIEQLARAISTLEKHQFAFTIDPAVDSLFDYIGPENGILNRLLFANRWLLKPLIIAALSRRDTGAAILRTTIAPTVFRAGTKEQSLPETGYAIVNFRTMPGQASTDLLGCVRATLRRHGVDVELYDVSHEASPRSRVDTPAFEVIAKTIREIYPGTIVAPALAPGRADAAYYYGLADDVYLFAPYVFSAELLETAHGHNERIAVANYFSMIRFYVRLIERLDGLHSRHQLESRQQRSKQPAPAG